MKKSTHRHNPVAAQRWRRFISHRRASVSAALLLLLLLISLGANLLCNDRPLYIRFHGKHLFPILQNLPESHFIPEGRQTSPDYPKLARSALFASDTGNRILFPPVPYGPSYVADPERIKQQSGTPVTLTPVPQMGSINIDPQMVIVRNTAAAPFFNMPEDQLRGTTVTNLWNLPPKLQRAIEQRFANHPDPAREIQIHSHHTPKLHATLAMPAFSPRRAPPRSIRLTFRNEAHAHASPETLIFSRNGTLRQPPTPLWNALSLEARERIAAAAADPNTDPASSFQVNTPTQSFTVRVLAGVNWPHPPIDNHWLGIDEAGRDVLARILYGLRVSLLFAICLVIVSYTTGIMIGAMQGFCGGAADLVGQRIIEIWATLPFLYVMMLVGSIFGRGFWILLLCYALFNWIGISYYVRAEFLKLRGQNFVDAARVMGLSPGRIILRHILPNALTPVITLAPISLVGAISSLAALDYLGFGLPALTPSLGQLLQQAQIHQWAWWLILYPSLALFIVLLLSVFVGEGIRKAYDPRPPFSLE